MCSLEFFRSAQSMALRSEAKRRDPLENAVLSLGSPFRRGRVAIPPGIKKRKGRPCLRWAELLLNEAGFDGHNYCLRWART